MEMKSFTDNPFLELHLHFCCSFARMLAQQKMGDAYSNNKIDENILPFIPIIFKGSINY